MKGEVYVSVIVVAFQAESFLLRCLDSVLSQTLKDIELIIVDDGSTDRTSEICDEYGNKDNRVRVFHKRHEGVSSARQVGIENAIGKYSIHCDADDWMEHNMLEIMYNRAMQCDADVVMCDVQLEYSDHSCTQIQKPSRMDSNTILSELYDEINAGVWNKLIRHSLYKKYNVNFPSGMEHAEDLYVLLKIYSHSVKTEYVPQVLYHYDKFSNCVSLTQVMDIPSVIRSISYLEDLEEKVQHVVDKVKAYTMMHTYLNNTFSYEEWKTIYPSVQVQLLKVGLKHPIRKRFYLAAGIAISNKTLAESYISIVKRMLNLHFILKTNVLHRQK